MKDMPEHIYKEFKKILYDDGGYDRWGELTTCLDGPVYEFKLRKMKKLLKLKNRYGDPFRFIDRWMHVKKGREKDFERYRVFTHSKLRPEDDRY